jgi:transposase-like protein
MNACSLYDLNEEIVNLEGQRSVLGVSVSLSEAEAHWRTFLSSLKDRGLHGVIMITSDDHQGLKTALKSVFNGVSWNRCHVHLQRNATAYVPKVAMRSAVARDIADILSAPNRNEARRLLDLAVEKYRSKAVLIDGRKHPRGLYRVHVALCHAHTA